MLQKVKNEISEELQMAKNVQDSLMPRKLPDFINMRVSSIYMPAAMVGGDFYDIVSTRTRKIAILIFDVSGHGVPAALIGATAKMLFAHYIEVLESPAKIFKEVNAKICSFLKTEHYLTAFLGIMDPVQNKMVYSRAGHVKPIVYHASNKSVSTLDVRGFFIGHTALEDIAEYGEEVMFFDPEDKILFYTDGLTEGYNEKNELYGRDRLLNMVQSYGELPAEDLLQEILEDQTGFRGAMELRDDFTMLCVQIKDTGFILKESGFGKEDAPNSTIIYTIHEIENVCAIILRAMDQCGFTDKEIKRTRVCIVEMIINGIIHGNKEDPNKKVVILYKVDHEKVRISVIDEGEGFDYHHLPNPLTPENLLKESGRGLFIVKQFVNEMHFNARGNRIFVIKYHGGKGI
jgi:anti-sigma regulatory factor (Ser/Thr protein kinase)